MKRQTLVLVGLGLIGLYFLTRPRSRSSAGIFRVPSFNVPGLGSNDVQREINRTGIPSWVDDTRAILGV